MAKLIAMAGKGGTGKTTFAALLIRGLIERGLDPVLAVDADPNATLCEALGIPTPRTIGMIREEFAKASKTLPAGMTKGQYFEYMLNEILVEQRGLDLLVMGRPEGAGCYCYVNNLLRGAVESLSQNYKYVVVDNEAGLEHLSRRTAARVDLMVILSDHSVRGIRSAHRVIELADEMGLEVRQKVVLVNRVVGEGSLTEPENAVDAAVLAEAKKLEIDIFAAIPNDSEITAADLAQRSLLELQASSMAAAGAKKVLDFLDTEI
jgi:CO dehydrogenase maturation factor